SGALAASAASHDSRSRGSSSSASSRCGDTSAQGLLCSSVIDPPRRSALVARILRRRGVLTSDVPLQQDAGLIPVPLRGAFGDSLQPGDPPEGEAAEEL